MRPRRAAVGAQLGAVPRRDRRLRRALRARRAHGRQSQRPPGALPLPGAGPDGDAGAREGHRRQPAGDQVLQPRLDRDRAATACARCTTACRALPGSSCSAPGRRAPRCKAALVEAGEEFGLRQVGSRVYATNTLESGWIPCPLPAVFTGDELKAYREWLPAQGYEGTGSLGGSFYSDDISDYYLTPHDLGYWPFVKFDHDFVGREALEAIADEPKRRKVTLAWNGEDVEQAMGSLFEKGDPVKYIDLPLSNYSTWPYDRLMHGDEVVGFSMFSGYSYNERSMLSLGMVDVDIPIGSELVLVWGEENGGSAKPVVERHRQAEIRAVVSPCPYSEVPRTSYAEGWRTKATV